MNALNRLRQMKNAALDRMTELNGRSRAKGRDLTETESLQYALQKTLAE